MRGDLLDVPMLYLHDLGREASPRPPRTARRAVPTLSSCTVKYETIHNSLTIIMKQWLSKFRAQRLKERFKGGVRMSPDADLAWWNQPLISLVIGMGLWGATSLLIPAETGGRSGELLNDSLLKAAHELLLLAITLISGMILRVLAPEVLKNNTRLLLLALCALTPVRWTG